MKKCAKVTKQNQKRINKEIQQVYKFDVELWQQNRTVFVEIRKIRTCFKTLVSKNAITWWLEKPHRLTVNFYKKRCLPVLTWTIKHSAKQLVSITCTLEKKLFCSCYFRRLVSPFFSKIVENCSILSSAMSIFYISRERKTKLVLFMRSRFRFLQVYIQFDVPEFIIVQKSSSLKCWLSFRLFLWWTQK